MSEPVVARIRIAIADDQPLIRSAFADILAGHDDFDLVAQASDGCELVEAARAHRLDVVLMDIRMPCLDGIEATRLVREAHPDTRVLVLTTFDLDEYVFAAIRAGASGFLTKDVSSDQLAGAIRAVHAGDAAIAPRAAASLVRFVATAPVAPDEDADVLLGALTPRERDVLAELVTGAANDTIAQRLYMTANTVKTHVKSVLAKLGLPDRVHVVIWAFEHGVAGGG